MKAPTPKAHAADPVPLAGETPAARSFDDALNDIDDCLRQIKEAADIMLDTAIGADIPLELFRRLSFGAKAIALYAVRADEFSNEAFSIVKSAADTLRGERAA